MASALHLGSKVWRSRRISERKTRRSFVAASAIGCTLAIASPARADDATWKNAAGGDWSDGANWSQPIVPNGPGQIATFGGISAGSLTVNVDGSFTVGGLLFDGDCGYTLAGSDPQRLILTSDWGDAAVTVNSTSGSAAHIIFAPLTFESPVRISVASPSALTLGGPLRGAGDLFKVGPGALNLAGNASAWSGGLTVSAGKAVLEYEPPSFETGAYKGLGTGDIVIEYGGTLDLRRAARTGNFGGSVVNNFTISGNGDGGVGAIMVNRGYETVLTGTITLDGDAGIGNINRGILHIGDPSTGAGALTGEGKLVKLGTGGMVPTTPGPVQLNVRSTHSGGTHVSAGTLIVSPLGSLAGTGEVVVDAGAQLRISRPAGNDPQSSSVSPNSVTLNGGALGIKSVGIDPATLLSPQSTGGVLLLWNLGHDLDFGTLPGGASMRLGATETGGSIGAVNLRPDPVTRTLRFGAGNTGFDQDCKLTVAATLADYDGVPTHIEQSGSGTTVLTEPNTYSGRTIINSGTLTVEMDGTLGAGAGSDADATIVNPRGTLRVNNTVYEKIILNGGTMAGFGNIVGEMVLAGDSSVGPFTQDSGVFTGDGTLTLLDSARLRAQNIHTGLTVVRGTSVDISHPAALGSTATGTIVASGDLNAYVQLPEPIDIRGGRLNLRTATYSAPITLSGGSLTNVGSIATPATIQSQITLNGHRSTIGSADSDEMTLTGGIGGVGDLVLNGGKSGLVVDVPILSDGDLYVEQGQVTLNAANKLARRLYMRGTGFLAVNAETRVPSLRMDQRGYLLVAPGKTLAIEDADLDLRGGTINGTLSGPETITKRGWDDARLNFIGASYDPLIRVERGRVIADSTGLGAATTGTIITSRRDAILEITGTSSEPIWLNNALGSTASRVGALTAFDGNAAGAIFLGDDGAHIGGPSGTLTISGPIHGGALTKVGESELVLTNAANTYTGSTVVGLAERGCRLTLRGQGRLGTTSEIIINSDASLILDNYSGIHPDRIADNIPITLNGGSLFLQAEFTGLRTAETVGAVAVNRGASTLEIRPRAGGNVALTLASLGRSGPGTVDFVGMDSSLFIQQPPALVNGIIGGWAAVADSNGSFDFAS